MTEDFVPLYAIVYRVQFYEGLGGIAAVLAVVASGMALIAAAISTTTITCAFIAIAAALAHIARSNLNRADSLYARAQAAELAEGGDGIELAEAA